MKLKKRIAAGVITGVLFILPAVVFARMGMGVFDTLPEPQLVYPVTESADLKGKDYLEFKWRTYASEIIKRRSYDFRLYKGYSMTENSLMDKQLLSRDTYSIKIDAGKFENNQVYTWSLKQISLDGQKSDLSYNSFKVEK